jgi:hypothetical protein
VTKVRIHTTHCLTSLPYPFAHHAHKACLPSNLTNLTDRQAMSFHPILSADWYDEKTHWVGIYEAFTHPHQCTQPVQSRTLSSFGSDASLPTTPVRCQEASRFVHSEIVAAAKAVAPAMIASTFGPLIRAQNYERGRVDQCRPLRVEDTTLRLSRSSCEDPLPVFVSTQNLLHRACFFGMGEERVSMILKVDPGAANRMETVVYKTSTLTRSLKDASLVPQPRTVKAPYRYPLHLRIASVARKSKAGSTKCNMKEHERTIVYLIHASHGILRSSDGTTKASSLAILIKEWSSRCFKNSNMVDSCLTIMDTMLSFEPSLAHRSDRQGSTPLHHAVQQYAPLTLLQAVYLMDPSALTRMNMHGVTPLDVAQRRTRSDKEHEDVVDFLKYRFDELHAEGGLP